jgi:hypothetical protein|tara:strand:- start:2699 stop:2911 length:213 start_codon:yes stop_codon:yes gene_type:complete
MRTLTIIALTLLIAPAVVGGIAAIAYGFFWGGEYLAQTFDFLRDERDGFALMCGLVIASGMVGLTLDDYL